jgi:hypothetical protein
MTTYDPSDAYLAKGSLTAIKKIDVNKFHEMIGHCGVDRLKKTANIHGLKLKGEFNVCEDFTVAKARQRNVNQDWKGGSQVPGKRVYLVDDHTDYCWSLFLKSKSDMKGKFLTLLTDLKITGLDVKFI